MKLKKWHKIVLVVLVVGGITGYFVWKKMNARNPDLKNKAATQTYTAQSLLEKLTKMDTLGLKNYIDSNNLITVNGLVKEFIASDSASIINIGDSAVTIKCQMDARHNDDAKGLTPGATVTVKGIVAGIQKEDPNDAIAELLGSDASVGTGITINFCILETKK